MLAEGDYLRPMQAADQAPWVSVEDYLESEKATEVRHEYIGGVLHAMAGGSREHNTICVNLVAALHAHLRGKPCRVFMADLKVRLQIARSEIFYYPDVAVVCDPRDTERFYSQYPRVLVEVLSPDTERTDRREKFLSYTQTESLEEYVIIAQDKIELTIFNRSADWQPEVLRQEDQPLRLPSIDFKMPVRLIYEGLALGA